MTETLWTILGFAVLIFIGLAVVVRTINLRRVTVYEYQKGLKYTNGRYKTTLGPGAYWVSVFTLVVPIDVRPEFITIQGQDVLSSDGVTLKVSLATEFQVTEPNMAVNKSTNYRTSLYLTLQMALREIVSGEKIDALLENRAGISKRLIELTSAKATELGLKLISADVKDIMFPGEMKKVFAQVVKAQKEGQAALERARGETAALRNLANAARTMDDNPNLLQLRALQALTESSGNTLVFGVPNNSVPLIKKNDKGTSSSRKEEEPE
jgi:regulator of protease activity HflC (stomatin/prohibitin superfamily)